MPPRRIILIVTLLVAVLHAYIGVRVLPDLPLATTFKWATAAWLVVSFLAIPFGLLARRIRNVVLAERLAWVGLFAMGLFSSLLVLALLRDAVLAAGRATGMSSADFTGESALAVPLAALFVTFTGLINARRLAQVVDVEVPIANLPAGLQGFTIVQISDIHVGVTIKHDYLKRIVDRVNHLNADLIAITGDLVDGTVAQLAGHIASIGHLRARHGAWFVTGNHEYYTNDADAWVAEVQRLGVHVLLNRHVVIEHAGTKLVVAGVTDYSAHRHHDDATHRSDPQAALAGAPRDAAVKLLLAHQPRSADAAADAGFDLQLSGHTHGGQFLPWNLLVPLQQPYTAGLHRLRNLWIYVSRGTGYWGPPKRFGAPSEITRLRLISA